MLGAFSCCSAPCPAPGFLLSFSHVVCFTASVTAYAQSSIDSQPLLGAADLDKTVFAASAGGVEAAVSEEAAKSGPSAVVWVKGSKPEFWRGMGCIIFQYVR